MKGTAKFNSTVTSHQCCRHQLDETARHIPRSSIRGPRRVAGGGEVNILEGHNDLDIDKTTLLIFDMVKSFPDPERARGDICEYDQWYHSDSGNPTKVLP